MESEGVDKKSLAAGLVVGLILGGIIGFGAAFSPVDTSDLEQQISDLQSQIAYRDTQIDNLQSEISNLDEQLDYRNGQIASLQTQITSLQAEISRLEKLVPPYTRGQWNLLETFSGSTDKSTELFSVPSSELRISWDLQLGMYPHFTIWLYDERGRMIDGWTSLEDSPEGETYVHALSIDKYYLEFSVMDIQYTVTIEAWIPE